MTQKVLIISTEDSDLRSKAIGWTHEDSAAVVPGRPIGYSRSYVVSTDVICYDCVLRALADGWKLLAPPVSYEAGVERQTTEWEWWLVKD